MKGEIKMGIIDKVRLNSTFTNNLPADPSEINESRQVREACYSYVNPISPSNPEKIHVSTEMLNILGIEDVDSPDFLNLISGAKNFPEMKPYAMCYGGHQFGHWAGQLGDGRAINIAEVDTENGHWALQLKGAGRTPYSRSADGLAVLRSSVREYLMSEAMFHLGVETTRALSLVTSGDEVLRDILYNGNAAYEKGAIVCRMAPSFVRFGNFEIFAARKDIKNLKILTDYVINHFYPHLGEPSKETYLAFFKEVGQKSMEMVLNWQRVGFVHGVMNTDNMSILGLTIDYGPYGWLENFDPGWTPNTTDAQHKRYRFGNQPSIVLWNLTQLANALYPLIEDVPALEKILDGFRSHFQDEYFKMMKSKVGLFESLPDDDNLITGLTNYLYKSQIDMTLFFRNLADFDAENPVEFLESIKQMSYLNEEEFEKTKFEWKVWLDNYSVRLMSEKISAFDRKAKMNSINPKFVLRNYMAHLAIEAADKGDYSVIEELYQLLKRPYDEQPEMEKWFAMRPDWATEKVGCSMLSCSS